mmetsp:Transcript_41141/g.106326  ORF Transcript_41141/g.106326 Transcript_41141/m.106326 type:complete len:108 (-) Transcript_41141:1847-2170(-)
MTTSEVRQEKREELQKLEAGLKRAEAQYAAEREETNVALSQHETDLQRLEDDIRLMKSEYKDRLRRSTEELEILSKQYDTMVQQMDSQKSQSSLRGSYWCVHCQNPN